jgi:hypothetical protein
MSEVYKSVDTRRYIVIDKILLDGTKVSMKRMRSREKETSIQYFNNYNPHKEVCAVSSKMAEIAETYRPIRYMYTLCYMICNHQNKTRQ